MKYSEVDLERIFDLDPGTISNTKGNDPCVDIFLKMIEACPFLIEVAKFGYDKKMASRIVFNAARDLAFPLQEPKR